MMPSARRAMPRNCACKDDAPRLLESSSVFGAAPWFYVLGGSLGWLDKCANRACASVSAAPGKYRDPVNRLARAARVLIELRVSRSCLADAAPSRRRRFSSRSIRSHLQGTREANPRQSPLPCSALALRELESKEKRLQFSFFESSLLHRCAYSL